MNVILPQYEHTPVMKSRTQEPDYTPFATPRDFMIVVIQSLSHLQLFGTPWTAAHQTSLSSTISRSLLDSYPLIQ